MRGYIAHIHTHTHTCAHTLALAVLKLLASRAQSVGASRARHNAALSCHTHTHTHTHTKAHAHTTTSVNDHTISFSVQRVERRERGRDWNTTKRVTLRGTKGYTCLEVPTQRREASHGQLKHRLCPRPLQPTLNNDLGQREWVLVDRTKVRHGRLQRGDVVTFR